MLRGDCMMSGNVFRNWFMCNLLNHCWSLCVWRQCTEWKDGPRNCRWHQYVVVSISCAEKAQIVTTSESSSAKPRSSCRWQQSVVMLISGRKSTNCQDKSRRTWRRQDKSRWPRCRRHQYVVVAEKAQVGKTSQEIYLLGKKRLD